MLCMGRPPGQRIPKTTHPVTRMRAFFDARSDEAHLDHSRVLACGGHARDDAALAGDAGSMRRPPAAVAVRET